MESDWVWALFFKNHEISVLWNHCKIRSDIRRLSRSPESSLWDELSLSLNPGEESWGQLGRRLDLLPYHILQALLWGDRTHGQVQMGDILLLASQRWIHQQVPDVVANVPMASRRRGWPWFTWTDETRTAMPLCSFFPTPPPLGKEKNQNIPWGLRCSRKPPSDRGA